MMQRTHTGLQTPRPSCSPSAAPTTHTSGGPGLTWLFKEMVSLSSAPSLPHHRDQATTHRTEGETEAGGGCWRTMLGPWFGESLSSPPGQKDMPMPPPPPLGPLTLHETTSAAQTLFLEVVSQPHSQTLPSQNVGRYPTTGLSRCC